MPAESRQTRFRSYRLAEKGGSYSYYDGSIFTLIEARYNSVNKPSVQEELGLCALNVIDTLHITSWDNDHCKLSDLEAILLELKPSKIEYPGYEPHSVTGMACLDLIKKYKKESIGKTKEIKAISVTPKYISTLNKASALKYNDVIFNPLNIETSNANDKSTVKFFRTGSFNVLSLGDVEDCNIASYLRRKSIIKNEVDIMIMAHHGADNGFTTSAFIKHVRPTVAVVGSNYANQYDHPKQEIRDLLYEESVKLYTTKTGDIVIYSTEGHDGKFRVDNYISENKTIKSTKDFIAKKRFLLNVHEDNLRSKVMKNRIYYK